LEVPAAQTKAFPSSLRITIRYLLHEAPARVAGERNYDPRDALYWQYCITLDHITVDLENGFRLSLQSGGSMECFSIEDEEGCYRGALATGGQALEQLVAVGPTTHHRSNRLIPWARWVGEFKV
jgi:hypothetical protein